MNDVCIMVHWIRTPTSTIVEQDCRAHFQTLAIQARLILMSHVHGVLFYIADLIKKFLSFLLVVKGMT